MAAVDAPWYTDSVTVRGFGDALTEAGMLESSADFQAFLKFPQRYNDAYDSWETLNFPDSDSDNWDEFVESLSDEEGEAEPEE